MARIDQPPLWEVVDKDGVVHASFSDKAKAFRWAEQNLGGLQDTSEGDERNGWDIQSFQR